MEITTFLIEASDGTTTIQTNRTIFYDKNSEKDGKRETKQTFKKTLPEPWKKSFKIRRISPYIKN